MGLCSDSRIELFETASDGFHYLFVFEFGVLEGLLQKLLIGFVLEISELEVFEGRLI